MKDLVDLLDPDEQEHVLSLLKEWVRDPECHGPSIAETLRREMVTPLENYLIKEGKKDWRHVAGDEAGKMLIAASDIIEWFEMGDSIPEVAEEAIGRLESAWRVLALYVGWGSIFSTTKGRIRGGKESVKARKEEAIERNQRIVRRAKEHLKAGKPHRELSGLLSGAYNLSQTQIRTILKDDGVWYKNRKKTIVK